MARARIRIGRNLIAEPRRNAQARAALRALKRAMADFEGVEIAEPAVKPEREIARAIKKAVRAFYQKHDAVERN
jgi:hypothetical protein